MDLLVLGLCVLEWHVMTLLLLPSGPSWLQDELAPRPLLALSWAEQVGSGAERPWEQHAWACWPQPPSLRPLKWEGRLEVRLGGSYSRLVFTEQLGCLQ